MRGVAFVHEDITARKRAEEQLRQFGKAYDPLRWASQPPRTSRASACAVPGGSPAYKEVGIRPGRCGRPSGRRHARCRAGRAPGRRAPHLGGSRSGGRSTPRASRSTSPRRASQSPSANVYGTYCAKTLIVCTPAGAMLGSCTTGSRLRPEPLGQPPRACRTVCGLPLVLAERRVDLAEVMRLLGAGPGAKAGQLADTRSA